MSGGTILHYGGTFDPPHNGHMALVRAAARLLRPDRIIIEPAGTPPHKAASATPAADRLAMCRCFLAAAPGVQLDDGEIRRGGKSYTVDTLRALRAQYPQAHIFLAMGSDMLLSFREWRCWREILQIAALAVQSREEGDEPELAAMARSLAADGGRVVLVKAPALEISSTRLREIIESGGDASAYVPAQVWSYIERHGLYGRAARTEGSERE